MDNLKLHIEKVIRRQLGCGRLCLLAALSGGADSVALLRLVAECEDVYVEAVHCNFHLRGEESMRDEKFCRFLCERLEIPLTVKDFDVDAFRLSHGGSVEMACRELRYSYFKELVEEKRMDRLVTGHNANDNAETLLLNLMRGAGANGLRGMSVDNGFVLRPMLCVTRRQITDYLNSHYQNWVEDHTNASSEYRRNFLRNEVLPLLEREWPGALASINKSAAALRGVNDSMCAIYKASSFVAWEEILDVADTVTVLYYKLRDYSPSVAVLEEMGREIDKHKKEGHAANLLAGKTWRCDDKHLIYFERDGIHVVDAEAAGTGFEVLTAQEAGFEKRLLAGSDELMCGIKTERGDKKLYLPADKSDSLRFRHPRQGDRMQPFGMKGSRLVSDILRESGMSRAMRQRVWLAIDDEDRIVWICGVRRSRLYPVTSSTSEVAVISESEKE